VLKPNKSLYRSLAGARASAKTEPISFDGGMTAFGVIGLPFQTAVELRHGSQLIPSTDSAANRLPAAGAPIRARPP
jgi:hypothetical protein